MRIAPGYRVVLGFSVATVTPSSFTRLEPSVSRNLRPCDGERGAQRDRADCQIGSARVVHERSHEHGDGAPHEARTHARSAREPGFDGPAARNRDHEAANGD